MTLSYAVSFFGLLLAFIAYQRNHHGDDMWRRRPLGVSFFSAVYGYVIPAVAMLNVVITLVVKMFKGFEYDYLIWTTPTLLWSILVSIVLFLLVGRSLWQLKMPGYAGAFAVSAGLALLFLKLAVSSISDGKDLPITGAYITAVIWHLWWSWYMMKAEVRRAFAGSVAQPAE
jgi:hypothetical protein